MPAKKRVKKRKRKEEKTLFILRKLHISIVAIVAAGILIYFGLSMNVPQPLVQPVQSSSPSPLICGANLDSQISGNQSAAKQLQIQVIRMADSQNYATDLQTIKNMGLTPLVVLHGCGVPDPVQRVTQDTAMVNTAQQVFGGANTQIYYEIGNENDLQCGLSSSAYISMWNALVPSLKQIAPSSWFIGPVNFQRNPSYVADFVHNANPKPDAVSWHEYTCNSSAQPSSCIQSIANWTTHITDTKNAITANADAVPPIMITEWNYAPDGGVSGDNKHNDPAFMTQWTTTALQTLIANNVYASFQFDVSNATPLIGTPQGQAFQTICQQILNGSGPTNTPTPSGFIPTPTDTVMPSQPVPSPTQASCIGSGGVCQTAGTCNQGTDAGQLDCTFGQTCCIANSSPTPTATATPTQPLPSVTTTPVPTSAGGTVCSKNHATDCSYTDNCSTYQNGTQCEFGVNSCGKSSSGNNVYVCKNGKWVYDHWTKNGSCDFCGGGGTHKNPSPTCSPAKGFQVQDLLFMRKNDCDTGGKGGDTDHQKGGGNTKEKKKQSFLDEITTFFSKLFRS